MKLIVYLFLLWSPLFIVAQTTSHIIPVPVSMQLTNGSFLLDGKVAINAPATADVKRVTDFFTASVKQVTGIALQPNKAAAKSIIFKIAKINDIGEEGYTLNVTPNQIAVSANTAKGLFYAVQSLLQILPFSRTNEVVAIPCMQIKDYPRFKWRGMMLDVSRHFFSPELVKEFIDLLSMYKMNTLHWHLVDGAGWRIEIKKYPKLTQQAAWRIDDRGKPWNWAELELNADRSKATYGGYYTQEQVKEIVAYAKARNVNIVPEIEMPGHSEAAMAAYPELSCNSKANFNSVGNFYAAKSEGNYCAGNDAAFNFLQDVLTEIITIFPSTYIHVGGDEVDKTSWKHCDKCQARMKAEGLKDENELQSYFMKRIEKFIVSKKRKMIGWDEILEGGLAPEATVMSWRGEEGGIQAAKMQHDVVMTPGSPLYFDHYQGDPETEPLAFGGFNTLKKVYSYEPIPAELPAENAKYILGSQANLWTEQISTAEHIEYMTLPRMPALAEVLWSPKDKRDWKNFNERLKPHLFGFDQNGIRYSKGNFKVDIKPIMENGDFTISLDTENPDAVIYYTLDGSTPTTGSLLYQKPFKVNSSLTVKAVMALQNSIVNTKPAEQSFTFNKATGKNVLYEKPFNKHYAANGPNSLTDGARGTKDISKLWHGFNGDDLTATIDLGNLVTASSITLGCLQNYGQWIFLPQSVKFEVSEDGVNFTEVKTIANTIPATDKAVLIHDFTASFEPKKIRVVRVSAKSLGMCPKGHAGEGYPCWIFADEIVVE